MATGNLTVTADIGDGRSVTALVFNDVREVRIDYPADRLQLILANGKVFNFDWSTIATFTHTISGSVDTVAIST